jgi:hypothetical protein
MLLKVNKPNTSTMNHEYYCVAQNQQLHFKFANLQRTIPFGVCIQTYGSQHAFFWICMILLHHTQGILLCRKQFTTNKLKHIFYIVKYSKKH